MTRLLELSEEGAEGFEKLKRRLGSPDDADCVRKALLLLDYMTANRGEVFVRAESHQWWVCYKEHLDAPIKDLFFYHPPE
jgi:hypothetical protein